MEMPNKRWVVSFAIWLLPLFLFFQACSTSQNAVSESPVFHFGESPCMGTVYEKSKLARPVVKRSFPKELVEEGTIVMTISVDRNGKVVYTEFMPELSTIKDQKFIMSCLEAMSKTTFTEDPNAPMYECGLWTINYKPLQ